MPEAVRRHSDQTDKKGVDVEKLTSRQFLKR